MKKFKKLTAFMACAILAVGAMPLGASASNSNSNDSIPPPPLPPPPPPKTLVIKITPSISVGPIIQPGFIGLSARIGF